MRRICEGSGEGKDMNYVAVAIIAAFSFLAATSAQAQNRFKDCAAQWNTMKEAKQTEGKNYREFQKSCLSKASELSREAGAGDIKSDKPKKKRTAKAKSDQPKFDQAKKSSPGREAATARRRECSAEWKADKAAGKVADGMKWPQYWSACNTRKKGAAA
jgi:hypothetical protein